MRYALLASALALASPAFATGNGPPQGGNSTSAAAASASAAAKAFQAQHQSQSLNVRNSNTNLNVNTARGGSARATGGQGGQGGAGGNAASSATGGTGGNATSGPVGVNVDASSRDRAYAMGFGGYAAGSGPCIGTSTSGGIGILGYMFQGGRTEIEEECQVREAARLLASMGHVGMATDLIRSLPSVRKAMASLEPPAPTPTAATTQRVAAAPNCSAPWTGGVMPPRSAGC